MTRHREFHPDTTEVAGGIVTRIARWYSDTFGTPTAFVVSLVLLAVWVSIIPIVGWEHWNAVYGLLGNTIESTGEWFFEVAILIVGVGVAAKQHQMESDQLRLLDHMAEILDRLDAAEHRQEPH